MSGPRKCASSFDDFPRRGASARQSAEALASARVDQPPHDETRYEEAARLSAALVRMQTFSIRPYQPARAEKGETSTPAS
ncbi:hypothetical protein [Microvirga ossetica]|uniref:hypothetical protein n=1 Tax=Microvirga ossetica TaxID=1882682 RepID=UPI0013000282|nr:hypothetical protein [Microvirga ossetica]